VRNRWVARNGYVDAFRGPIDLGPWEAVISNLSDYYKDCVIGGPEAFLFSIHQNSQLPEAIRKKLVQGIAMGLVTEKPILALVQDQVVDCMIGEKMGPFVPIFRRQGTFQ
jgi:hypothetical protein